MSLLDCQYLVSQFFWLEFLVTHTEKRKKKYYLDVYMFLGKHNLQSDHK